MLELSEELLDLPICPSGESIGYCRLYGVTMVEGGRLEWVVSVKSIRDLG